MSAMHCMFRSRVPALAALALVTVLLITGFANANPRRVAVAAGRPLPTLFTGWYGRYVVRPTSIYYTGDGSGIVGKLRHEGGLRGPGSRLPALGAVGAEDRVRARHAVAEA